MILKIFIFFLFSFSSNENKWYSKFLEAMYTPSGVSFNALIDQRQFDINSKISAYVEVVDSLHLLIEIDHETIILKGDTIKTYNKKTNQLIIDKLIDADVGIFSLLSGNLRGVDIYNSTLLKNIIQINFSLPSLDYNGFIEILKSGKPKRMRLAFSSDQYIEILIKDFKEGGLSKFNGFNPNPSEIINLYE
tara:strand:+ start:110 stop:682 length:573 start_codon:yes stop_codon:yes gene_type:complete